MSDLWPDNSDLTRLLTQSLLEKHFFSQIPVRTTFLTSITWKYKKKKKNFAVFLKLEPGLGFWNILRGKIRKTILNTLSAKLSVWKIDHFCFFFYVTHRSATPAKKKTHKLRTNTVRLYNLIYVLNFCWSLFFFFSDIFLTPEDWCANAICITYGNLSNQFVSLQITKFCFSTRRAGLFLLGVTKNKLFNVFFFVLLLLITLKAFWI